MHDRATRIRPLAPTLALAALATAACQSSVEVYESGGDLSATVVEADAEARASLFDPLKSLEGRWSVEAGEMQGVIEFTTSSNGSAVREVMWPGTEHEMTNMYTLDGNSVVMTHYCAAGNQPHMRARSFDGSSLAFETDGVSDLKATDELYMGEMTLVWIDDDHVEEHWRSIVDGERTDDHMVMRLTRAE